MREQGLKIETWKCQFFRSKVLCLGYVVSAKGVATDPDKTGLVNWPKPRWWEAGIIGTREQLSKVEPLPLRVGAMDIEHLNCVRNLGDWFDSMLSMGTHINEVCRSGFYYLHNLRGIRKYLSQDCQVTLITVSAERCSSHCSRPVLRQLHWLPLVKRIQFKILLLTFKAIQGLSSPFLVI